MSDQEKIVEAKQRRLSLLSPVYVMPVVAVAVAAWLLYAAIPDDGPYLELESADAEGIDVGKTAVRFRGVEIGRVDGIRLQKDLEHVLIGVQLNADADRFARDGAQYWIVRPELKLGQVSGLRTIIAGRYIQAEPGEGKPKFRFVVRETAPLPGVSGDGLTLTLSAGSTRSLSRGSGIYYRGIQIGVIEGPRLAEHATGVRFDAHIFGSYAQIVRRNSVFWTRSGLNLEIGLFKGIELDADSLQSLLSGAIEMATPTAYAAAAVSGDEFPLQDEAPKDWERWSPRFGDDRDASPKAAAPKSEPDVTNDERRPAFMPQ